MTRAQRILQELLSRGFRVSIAPAPDLSGKEVVFIMGDPGLTLSRQVHRHEAEIIALLKARAKAANHQANAEYRRD